MTASYILVPAKQGRGVRLAAGQRFAVIDVEGGQVVDLFAFSALDLVEFASAEHTRVAVDALFPLPGQDFVTNRRRPILRFEQDHSPGTHDMLCAACDSRRYELLGVNGWHASCQANLLEVMRGFGHEAVRTPQPINFFMDVRLDSAGRFTWCPATTAPGDFVVLRAEMACVVVASACPQDMNEINNYNPTSVALKVW